MIDSKRKNVIIRIKVNKVKFNKSLYVLYVFEILIYLIFIILGDMELNYKMEFFSDSWYINSYREIKVYVEKKNLIKDGINIVKIVYFSKINFFLIIM